ncbi:MAG: peptidylprolyl isomerase, partial [Halomonas sp.]|nr:peptidylprolyl isomerase [Halomonas sp.]
VPAPVVREAFRLPKPSGESTVYGRADLDEGVALIALTDVEAGEATDEAQSEALVVQLAERLRAQAAVQGLLESLRERAEIERL